MTTLSVIIVAYNYGKYLATCLESVYAQNIKDGEVLVVDDGSTDNTRSVLRSFPGIKYLNQGHKGIASARNLGLKNAAGTYIAFLDADDYWLPDSMNGRIARMKKEELQILYAEYENFYEQPSQKENIRAKKLFASRVRESLGTEIFHREVFQKVGLFNERLIYGEDTELFLRCQLAGLKVAYWEKCVLRRRIHEDNISLLAPRHGDDTKIILASVLRKHCHENNMGEKDS